MAGGHYDLLLSCQESVVLTLPSASISWGLLTLSGPQGIGSDFRFRGAGLGLGRGTHSYGSWTVMLLQCSLKCAPGTDRKPGVPQYRCKTHASIFALWTIHLRESWGCGLNGGILTQHALNPVLVPQHLINGVQWCTALSRLQPEDRSFRLSFAA